MPRERLKTGAEFKIQNLHPLLAEGEKSEQKSRIQNPESEDRLGQERGSEFRREENPESKVMGRLAGMVANGRGEWEESEFRICAHGGESLKKRERWMRISENPESKVQTASTESLKRDGQCSKFRIRWDETERGKEEN